MSDDLEPANPRVVIAQCTDQKRRGKHEARKMYDLSRLFRAQRRYAEARADWWWILSAKYGLVHPHAEISSYDLHISNQHSERFQLRLKKKARWLSHMNPHVEIIAGMAYAKRLTPFLDQFGVSYSFPFEGQGIGTRAKNMNEAAREALNTSLEKYA